MYRLKNKITEDIAKKILEADIWLIFSQIFSNADKIPDSKLRWEEIKHDIIKYFPEINMDELFSLQHYAYHEFNYFTKGIIPLSEGSYTLESPADVSGFYKAFGLIPKTGDSPDSIHYEFEFMSISALKIAFAPDDEKRSIAESAYKDFLNDHIARWIPKFCEKIKKTDMIFYKKISSILEKWIEIQQKSHEA